MKLNLNCHTQAQTDSIVSDAIRKKNLFVEKYSFTHLRSHKNQNGHNLH